MEIVGDEVRVVRFRLGSRSGLRQLYIINIVFSHVNGVINGSALRFVPFLFLETIEAQLKIESHPSPNALRLDLHQAKRLAARW